MDWINKVGLLGREYTWSEFKQTGLVGLVGVAPWQFTYWAERGNDDMEGRREHNQKQEKETLEQHKALDKLFQYRETESNLINASVFLFCFWWGTFFTEREKKSLKCLTKLTIQYYMKYINNVYNKSMTKLIEAPEQKDPTGHSNLALLVLG